MRDRPFHAESGIEAAGFRQGGLRVGHLAERRRLDAAIDELLRRSTPVFELTWSDGNLAAAYAPKE